MKTKLVNLLFEETLVDTPELKTGMSVYARKKTSSGTWMTVVGRLMKIDKMTGEGVVNNPKDNKDYRFKLDQIKIKK